MPHQLPSTTALLCFEASARHLSVSKAAGELHLTQSAVSRQIKSLEVFLDVRLFERVRQRLHLTDTGRRYLYDIKPLLLQLSEVTQGVRGSAQRLIIAAEPSVTSRWLIPKIRDFKQRYPHIEIDMQTSNNPLLHLEGFDLAIAYDVQDTPGYRLEPYMGETLLAVCAPGLLDNGELFAELADIVDYPVLHHNVEKSSTKIWFKVAGLRPDDYPGQGFDRFSLMAEAAREGLGIAVVPLFYIEAQLADGSLIEACKQRLETGYQYYLVTPEEKLGLKNIELFREWAKGLLSLHGEYRPL